MSLTHKPRLIALDLDGTVVNNRNEIPAVNLAALHAVHAAGVKLAFLTGRRPRTAARHLDTIGLPALVASNSGCLLWEYPGWTPLGRRFFPPELVQPLAELLAPHSVNFFVDSTEFGFDFIYLERQPSTEFEIYLKRWGLLAKRITDPAELNGCNITQLAIPTTSDISTRLRDEIKTRYGDQLLVMAVRWPLLKQCVALEVFHPEAHKGNALAFFAERLGIDRSSTVAVGDDVNDRTMLAWAGYGVGMPDSAAGLDGCLDEQLDGPGVEALAPFLLCACELPD